MILSGNVKRMMLERQHFSEPAGVEAYDLLFRRMSPMPTVYWTEPGEAPRMYHRAAFDDLAHNHRRRGAREIVKERVPRGVGYVCSDELELFAGLYRKPLDNPTPMQMDLLQLFHEEGPMNVRLIKEITGMLVKNISPALHRLQEAYLLFEDQADNGPERAFYLFDSEFPEVNVERYTRGEALLEILPRFAYLHGFIDAAMCKSFYGLPLKDLQGALQALAEAGVFMEASMDGAAGYVLAEDYEALSQEGESEPEERAFLLHRNDFLVSSLEHTLKTFPKRDRGILFYIMISGAIAGAVYGRFTFGPAELDDVWLSLPPPERERLKGAVIDAIYEICDPIRSPLARYAGEPV